MSVHLAVARTGLISSYSRTTQVYICYVMISRGFHSLRHASLSDDRGLEPAQVQLDRLTHARDGSVSRTVDNQRAAVTPGRWSVDAAEELPSLCRAVKLSRHSSVTVNAGMTAEWPLQQYMRSGRPPFRFTAPLLLGHPRTQSFNDTLLKRGGGGC